MKRKILYLTLTAVIGVTAFFIGKNFTEPTQQPETVQAETKAPELTEMTVENGGLYLEYSNDGNFYTYWIPAEDLENAGLINLENIEGWEHWENTEEVGLEIQGDKWIYTIEKDPYTADKVEINRLY